MWHWGIWYAYDNTSDGSPYLLYTIYIQYTVSRLYLMWLEYTHLTLWLVHNHMEAGFMPPEGN